MGLDTTAYEFYELLPDHPVGMCGSEDGDECYEAGHHELFCYATFPHALRGFNTDVRTDKVWGTSLLRAGWARCFGATECTQTSYSGHSLFRNELEVIGNWPHPLEVQRTAENMQNILYDLPFYELIWFADNEGVLGPVACENLLTDFDAYASVAERYYNETEAWNWEHFQLWHNSVRIAATTGLIHFH